jgi:hypothetical protein
MADSKARHDGIAISKFIFCARNLPDEGGLVALEPIEVEGAKLAAERITRQIENSRIVGRKGGKPRDKKPSKAALAKRESRARLKERSE